MRTASRVIFTESVSAQCPVPGISAEAGTPPFTSASSSSSFSSTAIEFASLLVPNTARPAQPLFISHLQCLMKRSASGERSRLNGVITGASTPSMRFCTMVGFIGGASSSVHLRAGGLDDRRPARDLGLDHLGHVLRRARDDVVAQVLHALLELGRVRALHGFGVEARD